MSRQLNSPKNAWFRGLYTSNVFLGSALLFLGEPMVGKLLLPLFGGSPAVWLVAVVFFQAVLLAGYVYAHWLVTKTKAVSQLWLHSLLVVIPLTLLPISLPEWAASGNPNLAPLRIVAILIVTVGAPYLMLAASGPLLQAWFAASRHPAAKRPYFLYAASNLGSFIGLLTYPFIVEPLLSLKYQARIWAGGYGIFAALTLLNAWMARHNRPTSAPTKAPIKTIVSTWPQRWYWLALAFVPSSLMLGVTTFITADVAAVPLLWMIPLALYLLTFMWAFGTGRPKRLATQSAPLVAAGLFIAAVIPIVHLPLPRVFTAMIYIALFALIALYSHSRLAATKPNPRLLTEFYLWIAGGGVLGGLFNSIVAPLVFNDVYELPIGLLMSAILLLIVKQKWLSRSNKLATTLPLLLMAAVFMTSKLLPKSNEAAFSWAGVMIGVVLAVAYLIYQARPVPFAVGLLPLLLYPVLILGTNINLLTERSFYGTIKVQEADGKRHLLNGITKHGLQYVAGNERKEPTTYYGRAGPLGDVVGLCRLTGCQSMAGIGQGVGTLAAYGLASDRLVFYEIDPLVATIASNTRYFSYLSDSAATVSTVLGDGRLSLQRASEPYNLMVIDAFISDAIPTHLLTREALQLYFNKLGNNGLLAVHISNRHLNLEPILKAATRDLGLNALIRRDRGDGTAFNYPSVWVVMARDQKYLEDIPGRSEWRQLEGRDVRVWTDDYSNILDAL